MAEIQREILNVLLGQLMEQGLISETIHDKAVNLVYSTIEFPDFFVCSVRRKKDGETNGCTQD